MLAGWVIWIARLLGPEGYGFFAGIAGIATTLGGISGIGMGLVMYQDTARNPSAFSPLWTKSLYLCTYSSLALFVIYVCGCKFIFPSVSLKVICAIGASEIIFAAMITNSAFAFAALNRIGWSSALPCVMATSRLIGLGTFTTVTTKISLDQYCYYHLIASIMGGTLSIWLVQKLLKPISCTFSLNKKEIKEGAFFCATWSASNALSSLDKTLVLKMGGGEMAGLYGTAYRFVNIFMQPIDALLGAATPKLFIRGADNSKHNKVVTHLYLTLIAYGFIAFLILWNLPFLLTIVLGSDFEGGVSAIRWLSLLIPLYAIRTCSNTILMSSNRVKIKLAIELIGIITAAIGGMMLINQYGIIGASFMLLISEGVMAIISSISVYKLLKTNN